MSLDIFPIRILQNTVRTIIILLNLIYLYFLLIGIILISNPLMIIMSLQEEKTMYPHFCYYNQKQPDLKSRIHVPIFMKMF